MRVCDYIAKVLHDYGVRHVFGIVGGGAAGLNDGFAKHGGFTWVGNHHEQGSAFAAMGMAKLTGRLAVVNPTTGCGGTNCLTGVLDAWQDSTPILFISGNVNRKQMTRYSEDSSRPRQIGVQEADIIPLVRSITKYAVTIDHPSHVVLALKMALYHAMDGRPGPVWLDVPTDVQTAELEEGRDGVYIHPSSTPSLEPTSIAEANQLIMDAERPLLLLGAGARGSHIESYLSFFPFVVTYGAIDIHPEHPNRIGVIGTKGDRAGNMAMANADLVLVLGSSLPTPVTGYDLRGFAPRAKVIVVDRHPSANHTLRDDILVMHTTIDEFLVETLTLEEAACCIRPEWIAHCARWRDQWPVCLPSYADDSLGINLYWFVNELSKVLPPRAAVVSDAGSALYVTCQALKLKEGQRHIQSLAQADMGWALPASIGVALEGVPTIVLTGDGSFQTNLQELATIKAFNLPVKVFVWNNHGYLSIRATQTKLFEGRLMGTDVDHGLWFPDLMDIARAYQMAPYRLKTVDQLWMLPAILSSPGPALIEVITPPDQPICPTIGAKRGEDGTIQARPLWDMAPHIEGIEKELLPIL